MRRKAIACSALLWMMALALIHAPVVMAAPPPFGALTQLPGVNGCIGSYADLEGGLNCVAGQGVENVVSAAVSPDGENVYAVTPSSDLFNQDVVLTVFERDPSTGALTQLSGSDGCITPTGAGGCAFGKAIYGANSVAVSPDGGSVYVAAQTSNAVAVFERDEDSGVLTQLSDPNGCVSSNGTWFGGGTSGTCTKFAALDGASSVAVSPDDDDGSNVYVASTSTAPTNNKGNSVVALKRDTTDAENYGKLSLFSGTNGCIWNNAATTTCAQFNALNGANSVTVSPDGSNVYVASTSSETSNNKGDSIVAFKRDTTGAADYGKIVKPTTLEGTNRCIWHNTANAICRNGNGLDGASSVAAVGPNSDVSPDGESVYVASSVPTQGDRSTGNDIASLFFDKDASKLTQLAGTDGCISEDGTSGKCVDGKALFRAISVAISPDGGSVYVASSLSDAVAIFSRDTSSSDTSHYGKLSQLSGTDGCVGLAGTGGICSFGRALAGASSVAVSPDGKNAYVTSKVSGLLAVFSRRGEELAPTCTDASQAVAAGAATAIALSCTDPNGDPITLSTVGGPANGSLGTIDQASGAVTYTPSPGFAGADSFTFQASDGVLNSSEAAANLTVLPGPSAGPPVAVTQQAAIDFSARGVKLSSSGIAKVRLACGAAQGDHCQGTLKLETAARIKALGKHARRVTLGRHAFEIPAGQSAEVKVRLSKANRRLIHSLKTVRVKAIASFHGLAGQAIVSTRTITLKAASR